MSLPCKHFQACSATDQSSKPFSLGKAYHHPRAGSQGYAGWGPEVESSSLPPNNDSPTLANSEGVQLQDLVPHQLNPSEGARKLHPVAPDANAGSQVHPVPKRDKRADGGKKDDERRSKRGRSSRQLKQQNVQQGYAGSAEPRNDLATSIGQCRTIGMIFRRGVEVFA